MPEPVRCLRRILADKICRRVTAIAARDGAVRRLEPAVELLLHDMAVGAGRRVVSKVGPTLGVGEGINTDANGNADYHSKQDALDHARIHLCFRFPTINDQSFTGKDELLESGSMGFKFIISSLPRSLHFQPHSWYSNGLNFLNYLPSINSGPEQVEGNVELFYGCQPPPSAR